MKRTACSHRYYAVWTWMGSCRSPSLLPAQQPHSRGKIGTKPAEVIETQVQSAAGNRASVSELVRERGTGSLVGRNPHLLGNFQGSTGMMVEQEAHTGLGTDLHCRVLIQHAQEDPRFNPSLGHWGRAQAITMYSKEVPGIEVSELGFQFANFKLLGNIFFLSYILFGPGWSVRPRNNF